ncbi:MAG: lytic transglycosylase domain-containing protein [Marinilabiliaceae bacterium]|nr:lytic transglycosylase domain-containing protein [Marinilabiliaceae bacterium]
MYIGANNSNNHIKILSIVTLTAISLLSMQLFISSSLPDGDNEPNNSPETYAIVSHEIPLGLNFANELVPIEQYEVKEAFERELLVNSYWQSQTLLFIKRSNRYFPIIEPILKADTVPDDFKYLALIESSFLERAESPAGAVGIWQFMKETGKSYGLEINNEVDERYHIEKATIAACKYLKKAKKTLGSWTLAAASYNAGVNGIQKQINRQKETNYYDLLFGEETGRYIYRILAAKTILSDPQKYGFVVTQDELYLQLKTYNLEITESITDIAEFAKSNGVTYKELKNLNPWLRETQLTISKEKSYFIKLPISNLKNDTSELSINP